MLKTPGNRLKELRQKYGKRFDREFLNIQIERCKLTRKKSKMKQFMTAAFIITVLSLIAHFAEAKPHKAKPKPTPKVAKPHKKK